jgi:ATP-dependent DNA helicase RecQ
MSMSVSAPDLLRPLKQYFGFDSFRPLQEQIIRDAILGKDVFALLPTGGGKSLCFQLPALVQPGLTLVISPLIALMKDQVDALQASGVAATFLNSSLSTAEARERFNLLHRGEYKLLYVAPERLMLPGFFDTIRRWNVKLIAIDEAHCISEWGHDFRPEYRQLAQLRDAFPEIPIMALTATATLRVREDIVTQAKLREPGRYVASFNRPNLSYRVVSKSQPYDQVFEFISARPTESGIVYCHSRKSAESVAAGLNADGIPARAYHAGMESGERSTSQEAFLRDEVRVVCATIAFGMGINKPNVRFVIHHDLPKNIESYYQETGRAGRDGLPSECVLLFSASDVVKQNRFIDEKPDPREQQVAREQLQQMVHYAESNECRRVVLLDYFGEEFGESDCGGCDNCLSPRETYDGTIAAQKFLSCVIRARQQSNIGFGLNHIVDVLLGGDTENVRKWNHRALSTYGIGKEHKRAEWQAIGRELIRLGFLRQSTARFSTLELTEAGRDVLKQRAAITLTKPMEVAERKLPRVGEITCDEALFEGLRVLRRKFAEERGVPPYIIFSDVTLRQMAREYPGNERDLMRINGIGEKKRGEFGAAFLSEIAAHLQANAKQIFAETFATPAPRPRSAKLTGTQIESLQRFRQGASIREIARARDIAESTVQGHLAAAVEHGEEIDTSGLLTPAEHEEISRAFAQHGVISLLKVKEALANKFDYGKLHISRALYQRAGRNQNSHSVGSTAR